MSNKSLIIVHGMGSHTEASVKQEVVGALKTVFSRYQSLKDKNPESKIDISVFSYNHYFEEYRAAVEDQDDIASALLSVTNSEGGILADAAKTIAGLNAEITKDNMFSTHWLDVLLYRFSLFAEPIQLDLASKIADEVHSKGNSNVHVLGHSLGTSVLHDALSRLYGPDPTDTTLSMSNQRVSGVHMVANVSRALETFRNALHSEVRPTLGCCTNFFEYRHKFDPIPKVKPFNPEDNGKWVTHKIWEKNYRYIECSAVTDPNIHSLSHYLLDPKVHLTLLKMLITFVPSSEEKQQGQKAFNETTLKHKAAALQDAVESFNFSNQSIENLMKAAKSLKDNINGLGGVFS
ncbi:MAG: hypothetical protein OXT49_07810 [Gammaproteobacteria bacterium]|nr:hypothetical protein [Gammaproteobacteria bacterium]